MNEEAKKIRQLISENKTEDAIKLLMQMTEADTDAYNDVVSLKAQFADIRRKENVGLMSFSESGRLYAGLRYSLLSLLTDFEIKQKSESETEQKGVATSAKKVFISYNHNDAATANKLKDALQKKDIDVIIDNEAIKPGEDIKDFIERSVKDTDVTLSIISKNSLLSAWVAMETINTFYHQKTSDTKQFIGCYIEDDFLKRSFTDSALDYLDEELKQIASAIENRIKKGHNTRDLSNEYTRLKDLSHHIDEIIRRLRESVCVNIQGDNFEKSISKIIEAVKG